GSHDTNNDDDVKELSKALAEEKDYILNDGQSSGVMRVASKFFIETIIDNKSDINKRLQFFPNPYAFNSKFANDASLIPTLKKWRLPLFRATHIMVAFDGGMGTKAEIEVALEMGCIVIPFFKDKKKDTWLLLNNATIKSQIFRYDSSYIEKVKKKNATYRDILTLIHKVLK